MGHAALLGRPLRPRLPFVRTYFLLKTLVCRRFPSRCQFGWNRSDCLLRSLTCRGRKWTAMDCLLDAMAAGMICTIFLDLWRLLVTAKPRMWLTFIVPRIGLLATLPAPGCPRL